MNSFEDLVVSVSQLKGLEEGFVAWDLKHDLRVKVKSP
ncbi:MAG: hypothetical protein Barrevirus34_6, partial [Barrevirus sp.]